MTAEQFRYFVLVQVNTEETPIPEAQIILMPCVG
jgi:hypothetical protein